MSLVGVGIAAVVGDLGGQALADFLTPHVFGAGVATTASSVEAARADGEAVLEGARFQGARYVGWARFHVNGAASDELKAFSDETSRDRWWAGVRTTFEATPPIGETDYASLTWARWVDTLTGEIGDTITGSPVATFAAGPKVPEQASAAFKVFTFASKAFVAGAVYAVGLEIGAFK